MRMEVLDQSLLLFRGHAEQIGPHPRPDHHRIQDDLMIAARRYLRAEIDQCHLTALPRLQQCRLWQEAADWFDIAHLRGLAGSDETDCCREYQRPKDGLRMNATPCQC